jgi:hypothetical protein
MINLLEFSFFHQYLYYPNSWLHKIEYNIKLLVILIYLCCIPYASIFWLVILNLLFLIIFFTLSLPMSYLYSNYARLIIVFCIFCVWFISINSNNNQLLLQQQWVIKITNYYIKLKTIKKLLLFDYTLLAITYKITIYVQILFSCRLIRLILIVISSLISHKLFTITTCNKDIFFAYSKLYVKSFSYRYNEILFILILSSECIYFFATRIKNIHISIYLRCQQSSFSYLYYKICTIYLISATVIYRTILYDIQNMTQSLYAREILAEKQKIELII